MTLEDIYHYTAGGYLEPLMYQIQVIINTLLSGFHGGDFFYYNILGFEF